MYNTHKINNNNCAHYVPQSGSYKSVRSFLYTVKSKPWTVC